jgi:hypothetical protein
MADLFLLSERQMEQIEPVFSAVARGAARRWQAGGQGR